MIRTRFTETFGVEHPDGLFLYGSPADVPDGIRRYVDAGVTTPVPALLGAGGDVTAELAAIGWAVADG